MTKALFLCLLAFSAAAQATVEPDSRSFYGIINRGSGRGIDVARAASTSGAPAVQWEFTHAASQQWHLVPLREGGEYYRLENKNSSLCLTLEIPANVEANATTPLVQRPFAGGLGQQWRLVAAGRPGSFQLENRLDGRVATVETNNRFNGTAVVAARGIGRSTQQWRLFQLQLRLATGPPYFAAPEPLTAVNAAGGSQLQPVPSSDGKSLCFNRTNFADNTEGVAETGDIWRSESADRGRTWGAPIRPSSPPGLNTSQNNAVQAVVNGPAGPTLLLRGTYDELPQRDLGVSLLPLSSNGRPAPLRIANFLTISPATGYFMTPDAKILLLSIDRGDSEGANDLYLSRPTARAATPPRRAWVKWLIRPAMNSRPGWLPMVKPCTSAPTATRAMARPIFS
ncbi:MAG: RICIN domain-containing protein [Hymenobacter sp.]